MGGSASAEPAMGYDGRSGRVGGAWEFWPLRLCRKEWTVKGSVLDIDI